MSYNGTGAFNLYTPGNPVVTGTTISSTWANNTLSDIATGLSTAVCKDGQQTVTANIPMSGFKITGVGLGTAATDAATMQNITNLALGTIATQNVDGWFNDPATWTYASASTFTVPGDQTAVFQKGTKIKWTQTTAKYGVVVSSSYGAPNTTVTIFVNTDYTIANAAITSPAFSYAEAPQSFPGWFDTVTPTWSLSTIDDGAGGQPTTTLSRVSIAGRTVTGYVVVSGTKATTANNIIFDPSASFPPLSSGNISVMGSAFEAGGFVGIFYNVGSTDWRLFYTSNITDNTVIVASAMFTYDW